MERDMSKGNSDLFGGLFREGGHDYYRRRNTVKVSRDTNERILCVVKFVISVLIFCKNITLKFNMQK